MNHHSTHALYIVTVPRDPGCSSFSLQSTREELNDFVPNTQKIDGGRKPFVRVDVSGDQYIGVDR